jgi:4,5-dihydroxyphthalate decarboxylase
MSNLAVRLAGADYARIMPLASGEVTAEGIDLELVRGHSGSWPLRAELLRRVLSDSALDGGESSMAGHLRRIEKGDRSFVALPVFILRGFAARDLYVRKDGPVCAPKDLIGKRLGLYSWVASGSIWYRHAQITMGVPLDSVEWWVGDVEVAGETSHAVKLPEGVHSVPPGRFLAEMLVAGDIDAMWSPPRPRLFDSRHGPLVRLFPDFRAQETGYFTRTGVFPMMHILVLRRDVWEKHPWIARSLTDAFGRSNSCFEASQHGFPDAFPWMEAELDTIAGLMGADPYGHGLTESNRKALEIFIEQARQARVIGRTVTVEDYFEEFLRS